MDLTDRIYDTKFMYTWCPKLLELLKDQDEHHSTLADIRTLLDEYA